MSKTQRREFASAHVFVLLFALQAFAQPPGESPAPPAGDARERMWYAPTAEDWKKPVLIRWQRTFDDAVQVSKETGKPIMIAVNMDGEIASEHYAGIRYRSPEIAKLFDPYVCVIASVYRHTPRDHDENGQRILCPRFGTVTCGEHIDIEPLLFDRYFEGQRVAPRHIMVELDGQETFDVYYAFDTASVFETIEKGVKGRMISPAPVVRGDRPLLERVASKDISDRIAVENAYAKGDREMKSAILNAAEQDIESAPIEVLRLAVFDVDLELARRARMALARHKDPAAADLIADALRVPLEASERDALLGALSRMGKSSDRAQRMAVVYRGLSAETKAVDVAGWKGFVKKLGEAPAPLSEEELAAKIAAANAVQAAADAAAELDLAEAFLEKARSEREEAGRMSLDAQAFYSDARNAAERALKKGASASRAASVLALCALAEGRAEEAHAQAEIAVRAMPEQPDGENSMLVLALFAERRHGQIVEAVKNKSDWSGQWLADMHAAHTLLLAHPFGRESQAISHYDFLRWLDARAEAPRFLEQSLERFPESAGLHERFRRAILRDRGPEGLTKVYETWLAQKDAPKSLNWFAGYAALQAAEMKRRASGEAEALPYYSKAQTYFQTAKESEEAYLDNSDHYLVLILGAKARMAMEDERFEEAVTQIRAAFDLRPTFAAARDGFNLSPVDTAKTLLSRLQQRGDKDLAARVQEGLEQLRAIDPKLLELPEFERGGRPPARRRRN